MSKKAEAVLDLSEAESDLMVRIIEENSTRIRQGMYSVAGDPYEHTEACADFMAGVALGIGIMVARGRH